MANHLQQGALARSGVECQVSGVRCRVSGVGCWVSGAEWFSEPTYRSPNTLHFAPGCLGTGYELRVTHLFNLPPRAVV